MKPEDLSKLAIPADPRISPDGSRVAWGVSSPNLEKDRYDQRVWVDDGEGPRPFTTGPGDTTPRWAPDGSRLAFLRAAEDAKPQVAVMPTNGGEPEVVTDFEYGVEAMEWASDGSKIAVVAVTATEEWAELDEEERKRRPRRITSVPYRYDNKGWTHDRRRHIWLIDTNRASEPVCVTPGEFDEEAPAWSPDRSRIAFVTDHDPARGLAWGNDVFDVALESGETTSLAPRGNWAAVSYRPDGVPHLIGSPGPTYPVVSSLHRVEEDGELTDLTGHLDRGSVALASGPPAVRWDGQDAVIGLEDSGRFGLIRVTPEGKTEQLVGGDRMVSGHDYGSGRLVFAASTWDSPGEIFSIDDGNESQLSRHSRHELDLVEPEHFRFESDGTELDVWVLLPPGDGSVPLLLNIHGGPASQYGFGFFDEFQMYAGAGYGVVACNPRGSSGRGQEFVRSVVGEGWGSVDLADIRAVVTAALERYPRLDPDRLGVMGGSYGGFLTAWVIGHEDRWRSAVVERALTSWTSFSGTSDIGGVFPENYTETRYPDAWDSWWRLSPLSLASGVRTPTLVLHSENDFRCPIEQSEQYFMALLRNGTTAEMIRFPDEGHELSRSGKPRHRRERLEAILDWHSRHLL